MSLNDSSGNNFDVPLSVDGFKKKILVSFIMALLGSGVLIVCSAQSSVTDIESEETLPDSSRPKAETESGNTPFFTSDPDFFGKSDYSPLGGEFSFKAVVAVLFVLALFIAAIYVSKKLLPKITNLPGREIRIIETVHLGPRKAVHLLEVYDRRFLIGSTNENVTKLADLGSSSTDLSTQKADFNGKD